MSNEGFKNVPGVPDGWELVHANRIVEAGEWYINAKGKPEQASVTSGSTWAIIRKIEQPDRYRAFANAEEFKPHRYRWWSWKDDRSNTFPPAAFGKSGHHSHSWEASFDQKVFDDGTPFGVKIDE
jgi:hypothetical protein